VSISFFWIRELYPCPALWTFGEFFLFAHIDPVMRAARALQMELNVDCPAQIKKPLLENKPSGLCLAGQRDCNEFLQEDLISLQQSRYFGNEWRIRY
jgi:hypothetical protein